MKGLTFMLFALVLTLIVIAVSLLLNPLMGIFIVSILVCIAPEMKDKDDISKKS